MRLFYHRYNSLNNVTRIAYPDGTDEVFQYVYGQMVGASRDRSGRWSYFDYDPMKRAGRTQDASGSVVLNSYDAQGNLTRLVDAKGQATRWTYDTLDRVKRKTYQDGNYDEYTYTQGVLSSTRSARGIVTSYTYDDNENLTLVDYPTTTDVALTYDALDRVTSMTDGSGVTGYTYDILSRVLTHDGPWESDLMTYRYDALGRQDRLQVRRDASNTFTTTYGYDTLSRLTSVNSAAGTWAYAYSGASDLLTQVTNPNTTKTLYGYEGSNTLKRLLSVQNQKSAGSNITQFAYGYTDVNHKDSRSFMERKTGSLGLQRVNYTYNDVDELTGEQATETTAITGVPYVHYEYSYDRMGNRSGLTSRTLSNTSLQRTYGSNTLNQIATQVRTPFTGTTAGASTTLTYTHDAGGNLTSQGTSADSSSSTYTYDDADRLQWAVQKNNSGVNAHWTSWTYDGLGRNKVVKEYTWNTAVTPAAWRLDSAKNYIYDGMDVVQERETLYQSDGVTVSSTNQVNFTRTGNIGGILAKSTGTGSLTHLFFHYDGSGNVVSLTDGSQNSVAEYSYDAYGNALTATGTQASSNAYRYSTKELHSWTGFYDYGYRFYSPALGRWINRDPIEEDGGLNLYAAFDNDPVNLGDEYGEAPSTRAEHFVEDWMTEGAVSKTQTAGWRYELWKQGKGSGWKAAGACAVAIGVVLLAVIPVGKVTKGRKIAQKLRSAQRVKRARVVPELITTASGKLKGSLKDLPSVSVFRKQSTEKLRDQVNILRRSVFVRTAEQKRLGDATGKHATHQRRITGELNLLRSLEKILRGRRGRK